MEVGQLFCCSLTRYSCITLRRSWIVENPSWLWQKLEATGASFPTKTTEEDNVEAATGSLAAANDISMDAAVGAIFGTKKNKTENDTEDFRGVK